MSAQHPVAEHYSRGDLLARFEQALRSAGKNAAHFTAEDLSSADQFHTGGKPATLELARLAGISKDSEVLDIGGGIGGPARTLAEEIGCRVTVLDLTDEFVETGRELTARVGLSDRVVFQQGDALSLPFPESSFDAVVSQHASMNISDKESLVGEAHRVLRKGGRYAFHDIMAGANQPILLPVPWATTAHHNFLEAPIAIRSLIIATGFRELHWQDCSKFALTFFQQRAAAARSQPNLLSVRLLLGDQALNMFETLARNFAENRVTAIMAVFEKS